MDKGIFEFISLTKNINKPCSEEEILKLEAETKIQIPQDLRSLYKFSNGTSCKKEGIDLAFNLMPIEEVQELLSLTEWQEELQENLQGNDKICAFWFDGNSNYAAVYLSGLLKGKICFINHEGIDLSPVFRSISTFYQSIFEEYPISLQKSSFEFDWRDLKTDYPILTKDKGLSFYFEDFSLAEKFIELFKNERNYVKRQHLAFCAMNLLPFSETEKILEFIDSDDMWIQERACELLGKKNFEKSIPNLADIALNGTHNGKIAAMTALRNFNTQESKIQIEKLFDKVEDSFKIYLKAS